MGTITGDKAATEDEILKLLKKIATEKDTKESLTKKLNDSFILSPNILGVGINLNKIFDNFLSGKKNKKS